MESKGEKLRLCGLDSQLRSVFATTRLDRLFDITVNEAGAITAVATQSPPFAETQSDNRKIGSLLSPSTG
jgi:hypothetical protein